MTSLKASQGLFWALVLCLSAAVAAENADADTINAQASAKLGVPFVEAKYLTAMELALAIFSAVFLVNFVLGWRANSGIGDKAVSILNPTLLPQFAKIGIDEKTALVKDGPADFCYYASGRRYCTGIYAWMELQNRQDLFARILRVFQPSMDDRCVLTVPLSLDNMEPISLFLVKPAELKRLKGGGETPSACVKAIEDIAGEVRQLASLPGKFHVLTDHEGVISAVLTDKIMSKIEPIASHIHSIQVTDSGRGWDMVSRQAGTHYVRAVFDMKPDDIDVVLKEMTEAVLMLVDAAANVKLPAAARTKAAALRKRIAAKREKERLAIAREEASERRAKEKRAAEEAKMEALKGSAAKQAKFEEKKRRQEVKQRMKKAQQKK